MNKKVVTLAVASIMIGSQIMGGASNIIESGAAYKPTNIAHAASTTPKTANKKVMLKEDGKFYELDSSGSAGTTVVTDITTIAELTIAKEVTEITAGKFQGQKGIVKLTFEDAANASTSKLTAIKSNAFKGTSIGAIKFPAGLVSIENNAFDSIPALKTVDFSVATKITTIGDSAFTGASITSLDLSAINPAGTVTIGPKAFLSNDRLTSVTLPEKLGKLDGLVFYGTKLTTIEINKSCTAVNSGAFPDTLQSITVKAGNTAFTAQDGVLYNFDKTSIVTYPNAKAGDTFAIPSTVNTIGTGAFSYSKLTSISIPAHVKTIGDLAFSSCARLTSVKLSSGLTAIGDYAFSSTPIEMISIPDTVTKIGIRAFSQASKLTAIDLRQASALASIGDYAFHTADALSSMIISDQTKVFSLGSTVFEGTPANKTVSFKKNDGTAITGTELTALQAKFKFLTEPANGGFSFGAIVEAEKPNAAADYEKMKLTKLTPNAVYIIQGTEYTANGAGEIDIKKEWSAKSITIVKKGSGAQADSAAQTLMIDAVYSITVDGREIGLSKDGKSITVKAAPKEGHRFKEWQAMGVTLSAEQLKAEQVTFPMPAGDVTLTATYTQIITTTPQEMIYDGQKEVTIRFELPITDFVHIEYNGAQLVKDKDYTVVSGSTVITFKKAFLDTLKDATNRFRAVFTSGPVEFSVQVANVQTPPTVTPPAADNVTTVKPSVTTTQSKTNTTAKKSGTNPKTGDNGSIIALLAGMMASAGALVFAMKKKSVKNK